MQWLVRAGAYVFTPLLNSPDYDLVADFDGTLVRVRVKTSTCWRNGRWEVRLATSGGNRSWTGVVKRLDRSRCDYLFVHVGDGRRWYIPACALGGQSAIALGGPKYSQYEIQTGGPLASRALATASRR
jgi:hypothetical protein